MMHTTDNHMGLTRLASGPSVTKYPLESRASTTRGVSKGKLASIDGLKLLKESAVISSVSAAVAAVQPHYMNTCTFINTCCIRVTLKKGVRSTAGDVVPLLHKMETLSSLSVNRLSLP